MSLDIHARQKTATTLKTVGKFGVRTVHGSVRTSGQTLRVAKHIQRQSEDGESYATDQLSDTGAYAGGRLTRKVNRRGRQAAKAMQQGKLTPIRTVKAGAGGIKPAAREAKSARKALTAARRSPQATAMIRQAQKRSFEASKSLAKASGKAVGAVIKAAGQALKMLLGNAWLLAGGALLVVIICLAAMFMDSSEATDIEYVEPAPAIYYFLRTKMELNPAAACAVMANIEAESGFNVNSLGDTGTSYGLCQWHLGRWDRLEEFCMENGYASNSIQGQLYYFQYELENYYPDVLEVLQTADNDAGSCYDAASYFCIHFERPDKAEEKGAERGDNAVEKYWYSYGLADEQWTEQGMALALTAYMELGNDGGYKYWSWYGYKQRVEWCCIFVSWCANQNGYLEAGIMPRQQGTDHWATGYPWYYSHGTTTAATPDVIPQPGYIPYFYRGHVGIVYACDGEYVYLVEGNSMDNVRLNRYSLADAGNYFWYAIPPYTE